MPSFSTYLAKAEIMTEQGRIKGVAPVKKEYLKPKEEDLENRCEAVFGDEGANENSTEEYRQDEQKTGEPVEEPPKKKQKRERKRGQNKDRVTKHVVDKIRLCQRTTIGEECTFPDCKLSHDLEAYLACKPPDIGDQCVHYNLYGKCPYGYKCRYLKAHLSEDGKLIVDEERAKNAPKNVTNFISRDFQKSLRTLQYPFPKADAYLAEIAEAAKKEREKHLQNKLAKESEKSEGDTQKNTDEDVAADIPEKSAEESETPHAGEKKEEELKAGDYSVPDVPLRQCEKKTIDFRDKLYLAPLTTVGNLPFRRICKEFGVDITCSEMAMATNLLQGQQTEWALVRKHKSEDIFGIQLAGNKPDALVKTAEMLNNEIEMDFLDLNMGCPVDLVFNKGGGSALLDSVGKMGKILRGMVRVVDVPVTAKFRMGVKDNVPTAHKIVPKLEDWGISLGTLHGRSRQQRYTKLADWDYIAQCSSLRNTMSFFGNGDVLSYEDYYNDMASGVDGIMIGRGALIKPWLFDEIKSRRHWDISSRERFDMLRRFCDYGLEHWGSDTLGVNQTRRYLCEWQSFLHRYVPVGLLEVLPQKMNERPPAYYGRDELETLMASSKASDWVKISEMLLGPAPSDFKFIPKHKANSYEG
ncbi:uncharacterized protein VTP21DRAFT_1440 [Calcarisporiella thermophila]|uniref:uncharacterized protein n=1 Tax=Calcarisporiella thermophila TaxID=911321 RepID=UPI0037425187